MLGAGHERVKLLEPGRKTAFPSARALSYTPKRFCFCIRSKGWYSFRRQTQFGRSEMRRLLFWALLSALPLSTAWRGPKPKHNDLVPPPQSTVESRRNDIRTCIAEARGAVASGQKPLDEKSKEALKGRRTRAFIRNGLPVVDKNYVPATSKSLFTSSSIYGPEELSDRYVVCLLGRGYRWADEPADNAPAPAPMPGRPADALSAASLQCNVTSIRVQGVLGTSPSLVEGEGGFWTCEFIGGKCYRVDTNTSPAKLIPLGLKNARSLAAGFGSLWVAVMGKGADQGLHRLDPKTNEEVAKIPVNGSFWVFIADGSVWVTDGSLLYRVDPKTNQVTAKISVEKNKKSTVAGDVRGPYIVPAMGSVWVLYTDGTLNRIDPETNQFLAEVRVGPRHLERFIDFTLDRYFGLAVGEGSAWITEYKEKGNLIRVDLKTNQVVATIPVGYHPQTAVVGGGFVWVSVYYTARVGHFVVKIDPRTNQILGTIFLKGGQPYLRAQEDGILAWSDSIWKIRY